MLNCNFRLDKDFVKKQENRALLHGWILTIQFLLNSGGIEYEKVI